MGVSENGLLTDCKNGDKLYRHYFHTRPIATPRYIIVGVDMTISARIIPRPTLSLGTEHIELRPVYYPSDREFCLIAFSYSAKVHCIPEAVKMTKEMGWRFLSGEGYEILNSDLNQHFISTSVAE